MPAPCARAPRVAPHHNKQGRANHPRLCAAAAAVTYLALFPLWLVVRPLNRRLFYAATRYAMAAWCIVFTAVAER